MCIRDRALTPLGLSAFGFELIYGVWFMAATIAAYIIRKPGAALITEVLASAIELLMGNSGGATVVLTGLILVSYTHLTEAKQAWSWRVLSELPGGRTRGCWTVPAALRLPRRR